MDIVSFWKQQTDLWNEQNKCGLCWEFSAPLVHSQINVVQTESCCANVFLTDVRFRENIQRSSITNMVTSKTCVWNFSLWCLVPASMGLNNYNEMKGHPVDESKWNTIFKPIIDCLGCGNILDTCVILGETNVNVDFNGDAVLIHNYLDNNYNGWRVNYTFTQIT